MSLKIKTKSRFNLQLFWNVWIPLPPLSPRNPHTPASLHLTFPLATRVHMRRPSDFRFTFANTVAVIHNKASCCFHFVLVQLLPGWFYIGYKTQSLRDVFRCHGSKIYEEAVIKIEENYSLKIVFKLTFPLFLVYTDWVCASGLRYYCTCNLLDFRFRPQEYGYSRAYPQGIDQLYPTLITLSSPRKRIHDW